MEYQGICCDHCADYDPDIFDEFDATVHSSRLSLADVEDYIESYEDYSAPDSDW